MNYWLMKSEPNEFSIDDLRTRPEQIEPWDGMRNYQARNMMRDQMQIGDQALFYHSARAVPGVVGVMKVNSNSYADFTAFDREDAHFDPKSDPDNPRWFLVDVKLVKKLKRVIPLAELREHHESALKDLVLLRKGNRLSIMPMEKHHFDFILTLE
jgi:predicted RNA-binding protein with PUA-like domain